jgi:hypothetical protein
MKTQYFCQKTPSMLKTSFVNHDTRYLTEFIVIICDSDAMFLHSSLNYIGTAFLEPSKKIQTNSATSTLKTITENRQRSKKRIGKPPICTFLAYFFLDPMKSEHWRKLITCREGIRSTVSVSVSELVSKL